MSKLTDEQIAAIRDGCEGVTPGPWALNRTASMVGIRPETGFSRHLFVSQWPDGDQGQRDTTHIARCDPGTIRDMATELLEARAENDRMRGVLDESYSTLAAAFNRIHGLPRTSDTELAKLIETTRAKIERARAALGRET